jgi:DNA-binding CsgD family transcriptional regulator
MGRHIMSTDPKHGAAGLVATEGNKPMSASKLVAVIPTAGTLGSKDREVTSFAASRLSGWGARSAGDHSAQLSGRDELTARERDVLAMISHGLSNKRIARALEISPETVKSHVKRIFLKLTVSTRAEAVSRAGPFGLLPYGEPTPTASRDKRNESVVVRYRRSILTE